MRSLHTMMKSSPRSPQLEKARAQQRRPDAAKKKKNWTLTSPLGLHRIVVQFGLVLNLFCSFQRKSDGGWCFASDAAAQTCEKIVNNNCHWSSTQFYKCQRVIATHRSKQVRFLKYNDCIICNVKLCNWTATVCGLKKSPRKRGELSSVT